MAGNCGFAMRIVAASFYDAIVTGLNNGKNYSSLKKVSLILFDKQVTEDFIKHFIDYSESMINRKQSLSYINQVGLKEAKDVESNVGEAASSQQNETEMFCKDSSNYSYEQCSGCAKKEGKMEKKLDCTKHTCCLKCYNDKASCLICLAPEKISKTSIKGGPLTSLSATNTKFNLTSHSPANKILNASIGGANKCTICLDTINNSHQLSCGHAFCKECIDEYLKNYQAKCPICGKLFGKLRGNQPKGDMKKIILKQHLSGYSKCGTMQITYHFPDGIQTVSIVKENRVYNTYHYLIFEGMIE